MYSEHIRTFFEELQAIEPGCLPDHPKLMSAAGALLSQEDIEYIAEQAHSMLKKEEVVTAHKLFAFLCILDTNNTSHWIFLGICQMQQKMYDAALATFGIAAAMNSNTPLPYLFSAALYAESKNREDMQKSLKKCMQICKKDPLCTLLFEFASDCYTNETTQKNLFSILCDSLGIGKK